MVEQNGTIRTFVPYLGVRNQPFFSRFATARGLAHSANKGRIPVVLCTVRRIIAPTEAKFESAFFEHPLLEGR